MAMDISITLLEIILEWVVLITAVLLFEKPLAATV